MKRIWIGIVAVLFVLAVGGGAFWAGMSYGRSQVTPFGGRSPRGGFGEPGGQFTGPMMTRQARQGDTTQRGSGTMGTIQSIEGDVVIIDTREQTIRVETTDTTLIEKYMPVSVNDLEVDEQVIVTGRQNQDGSITARSIQLLRAPQFGQPTVVEQQRGAV